MAELPIIVLAFANEQEGRRYLRDLPEELRQLQAILEAAEGKGLCRLVVRPNARLDQILETFTEHRDRVSIFHYGGHAGGDRLFLETTGTEGAVAHAEGLATFLGQRRNLQLVFLNGCSTRAQAAGLLDAGVAAVIATARAIEDAIALEFAAAFYSEVASGQTLRAAFEAARGRVLAGRGPAPQAYFRSRELGETVQAPADAADDRGFPWELRLAPGAELDGRWNLPEAVGNPLFGLPAPSVDWLPETPYRGLQRFTRDESAVFFGRGRAIRELYNLVIDPGTRPVILYYGPTGVGKSSVLDAGLAPRLEQSREVHYLRRDPELGLLGTLCFGLAPAKQGADPGPSLDLVLLWLDRERPDRPLVVVLDQAEEAFTRPRVAAPAAGDEALKKSWIDPDAELAELLAALRATFAGPDPARRPRGKLIVSFRNEWLDRFEQAFNAVKLGWEPMPLRPLEPSGIIEAIEGPARDPALKRRYGLTVDDRLARAIAEDLVIDAGSALAPTLQVLLTNMWKGAGGKGGRFDQALYRRLRDEGYLLQDVLEDGLKAVRQWHEDVESSGLALDVLVHHVTEFDTAARRTRAELAARYPHRVQLLAGLLETLKEGYLLIEADASSEPSVPPVSATRLAHDTLAPLVHARFRTSVAPAQRARRLLENRAPEWQNGKTGSVLDAADLASVEAGVAGMRAWTADETRLVTASWQAEKSRQADDAERERQLAAARRGEEQAREEKQKETELRLRDQEAANRNEHEANQRLRRRAYVLLGTLVATLVFALLAGYQWRVASTETVIAEAAAEAEKKQTIIAEKNTKLAEDRLALANRKAAEVLTATGISALEQGHSFDAMHRFAEAIVAVKSEPEEQIFNRVRLGLLAREAFPLLALLEMQQTAGGASPEVSYPALSPDGSLALILAGGKPRVVEVLTGRLLAELPESILAFSPNESRIATVSGKTALLWEVSTGAALATPKRRGGWIYAGTIRPDGVPVVVKSVDETGRMREVSIVRSVAELRGHTEEIISTAFSPDGAWLRTWSRDNSLRVWDALTGLAVSELKGAGLTGTTVFSPDGTRIVTTSFPARVWETATGRILTELKVAGAIDRAAFSPDGTRIVTTSGDKMARLWDAATGRLSASLTGHGNTVNGAEFNPDGTRIITASGATAQYDYSARIWGSTGGRSLWELKHPNPTRTARFSPQGTRIITAADYTTKAWIWGVPEGGAALEFKCDKGSGIHSLSPDGTRIAIIAPNNEVRIQEMPGGRTLAALRQTGIPSIKFTHDGASIKFTYDGSRVMTRIADGTIRVWDLVTGRSLAQFESQRTGPDSAVAISADGSWVVAPVPDNAARVWNVATRRSGAELKGHANPIVTASFSRDATRIVTTAHDKTARVWETSTGRGLAKLDHTADVRLAALSPDGSRVVTRSGLIVRIWEVSTGRVVAEFDLSPMDINTIAFSPDGLRVLIGTFDNTVRVWDIASGQVIAELKHSGMVASAAFSPNGARIVTALGNGTARVWELRTKQGLDLTSPLGIGNFVDYAAFSPDGMQVLTRTRDGVARRWQIEPLPGEPEALPTWVQVITGTEIRAEAIAFLSAAEWKSRCGKLEELRNQGHAVPPTLQLRENPQGHR